jgi:putrescine importer
MLRLSRSAQGCIVGLSAALQEQTKLKSSVTLSQHLTPFSVALFGLSYICPTVIFSTFGVLARATQGATASAYLIATIAILFTAVSYGRMAARWPQSGSAYTYVSRATNDTAGFIAGWLLILDYFLVPMVICLFTAKAFEIVLPNVSFRLWVALIVLATTVINVLGVKIANRVNLAITAAQFVVIVALIILCIVFLRSGQHVGNQWTIAPFLNSQTALPAVMSGAAIAAYSFLGFDAVTTLSEETINPTRSIPRATVFAAAASGSIYVVCAFLLQLVHPSAAFHDVDNAGYEILASVSGRGFPAMFTVVLCAYIASVMCAQAGSSRLLYAMGRDGSLPRPILSYLHPRFRTPALNIGLIGIAMLAGEFLDVEAAAACVNFGAFSAFTAVNLSVIYDHVSGRRQLPGGLLKLLEAAAGAVTAVWLIVSLHRVALTIGLIWLLFGAVYAFARTRAMKSCA